MALRIFYYFGILLQHRDFILWINGLEQQCVKNMLWTQVFQRLRRWLADLVLANNEFVLHRNGQFKTLSIAHHVKHGSADYRHQPDQAQHLRFAHQHPAAYLRIVSDFVVVGFALFLFGD